MGGRVGRWELGGVVLQGCLVLQGVLTFQGCGSEKTYQRVAARSPTDGSSDARDATAAGDGATAGDAPSSPPPTSAETDAGADGATAEADSRVSTDGAPAFDAPDGDDAAVGDGQPTADASPGFDGSAPDRRLLVPECGLSEECASGHCAQGVCCDRDCGGACEACNQPGSRGRCTPMPLGRASHACGGGSLCGETGLCGPDGQCALASTVTTCTAPSCQNGVYHAAGRCDGHGSCVPGPSQFCGLGCNPGGGCSAGCAGGDSVCVSGSYCTGNETCLPKKASGVACGSDHECLGGDCRGGVCASADAGPRPPADASARF